jgi:hypothetical protein
VFRWNTILEEGEDVLLVYHEEEERVSWWNTIQEEGEGVLVEYHL